MFLLLLFFFVSIFFSFLCSVLEAVLLSVTPSYIGSQVEQGTRTGKLLQLYKKDIDRPLSAILTLNTIAHTVGAIGVGAQAGKLYGAHFFEIFGFRLSYESIIAVIMTLAILLLSEIIPKTLGANNWKALSPFTVKTIKGLLFVLSPLVALSQFITKRLKTDKDSPVLSRADFLTMTRIGESSGALEKQESQIIKNLLEFEHLVVKDIMTPRSVAFLVPEKMSVADYLELPQSALFSRVPVYRRDKDDIIGLVLKDEVLGAMALGQGERQMKDLMHGVDMVPDDLALPALFSALIQERKHLKVVRDEFGHCIGLVTMEDVIETLLGEEIMDESDKIADLQAHAKDLAEKGDLSADED